MSTILDTIIATKHREVETAKSKLSEAELERRAAGKPPTRDFAGAIAKRGQVGVIAEVKKASPSAGLIRPDFDPVAIARTYEQHGAAAISVLTDRDFFQGELEYLTAVRSRVSCPVLRKDFILDHYQLLEARVAGADAVLLIAECLPGGLLKSLHEQATDLGLQTLMEFHDAEELPRVLETGCRVIGINNRDLRSFKTRLGLTLELLPKIPEDRVVVSESGIGTHEDLIVLGKAGAKAVLVGESLMRSADIGEALDRLRGVSQK
jgi:indole-3-glycerol phosphate synthase